MDSTPPYAVCPDCKQDIRASEPHCAETPNVTVSEGGAEDDSCAACSAAAPTHRVSMRWHCRARAKYRNREMANPLHSVDHWTWLNYDACARCAAHAAESQTTAIGWDYWDAIDGVPTPAPVQSFTAFYCLTHDQGALVEGQHDELPEGVRPCGAAPAHACDYVSHGRLEVEGDRARAVDFDLDRDYGRYAGGWAREHFAREVYLRTGEETAAPPALAALLAP
jgi:hypothetical protein